MRSWRTSFVGLLLAATPLFTGSTAEAAGKGAPAVAAPHAVAEAPATTPSYAPHVAPVRPMPASVTLRASAKSTLGAESAAHILPVLRQDPAAAHELLRDHGDLVSRVIRIAPVHDFGELKTEVLKQAKRVDEPVAGLYQSIPAKSIGSGGWKNVEPVFDKRGRPTWTERTYDGPVTRGGQVLKVTEMYRVDPDGTRHLLSEASVPERLNTTFETSFDPKAGVIKYSSTFLGEIEPWVENKIALRQNNPQSGVPTSMAAGLSQLRILGVPYGKDAAHGGPSEVVVSRIFNFETVVQLHWLKQQYPNEPVEKLLETTDSVTFTDSQLRQAGYKVARVSGVENNKENPTGKNVSSITGAMKWFESEREKAVTALRGPKAGREARVELEAVHDALLARYGFNRRTWMYYDFSIHLEVEPVAPKPETSSWLEWRAPEPTLSFWIASQAA